MARKSLVVAPFIPVSSFGASHRGAQGVIYTDMIAQTGEEVTVNLGGVVVEDFNEFDRVYVYHGNDWGGTLNIYGGLENFPYAWNFLRLTQYRGEVISLAIPFPDYHGLLKHKFNLTEARGKGGEIQEEWRRVDWDNLLRMQSAPVVVHPNLTERLVVGDSHAISMYRPGWTINSIPFRTLFGQIKRGLAGEVLRPYEGTDVLPRQVELYFGNIDVRHHLCRQPEPIRAAVHLADSYASAMEDLAGQVPSVERISAYELLPIETEERRVPKTGYYEGTPFFGSREERDEVRLAFRDRLESRARAFDVIRWTDYLLDDQGRLDEDCMEYKQSVHLSRSCYPFWNGLDYNRRFLPPHKNGIPRVVRSWSPPTTSLEEFFA